MNRITLDPISTEPDDSFPDVVVVDENNFVQVLGEVETESTVNQNEVLYTKMSFSQSYRNTE
jgi:hypothetical protein